MLTTQPFVSVFAINFSKAFDTVSPRLATPDAVYNWINNDFFRGHSHCVKFDGSTSKLPDIMASIIQGSAIDPPLFVVIASDLLPVHAGNLLVKFADDTYVIVPAANSDTSTGELKRVQVWAEENNLKLNFQKKFYSAAVGHAVSQRRFLLPVWTFAECTASQPWRRAP